MAYEFKSLGTVDVVETASDTANVLIEEDGEIKRVAKSGVGGNKDTWDAIIDLVPPETETYFHFGNASSGDSNFLSNMVVSSGAYEAIRNKILAGENPKVLIRYDYVYGSTCYRRFIPYQINFYSSESSDIYIKFFGSDNDTNITLFHTILVLDSNNNIIDYIMGTISPTM